MATSVVELCNLALDRVGAAAITSIDDASESARYVKRNYAPMRDAVLRGYPWNAAIRRASLSAEGTTPSWGFDYQYVLPAGPDPEYCLRVLGLEGEDVTDIRWKVEGRRILTDEGAPLAIHYLARIEDPTLFDPLLDAAIAARLAWSIAFPLTKSNSLLAELRDEYRGIIAEARRADAQEGTADPMTGSTWLESRA